MHPKEPLNIQSTQVRVFCSQMSVCTPNPLESDVLKLQWIPLLSKMPLHPPSTQLSPLGLKCAFAPSIHSNKIILNSNLPMHLQFNQFKLYLTQMCMCTLKHTQIKSFPTQKWFCPLISTKLKPLWFYCAFTLKWSPLQLKSAFQTQTTQIMFCSTQMCFWIFKSSKLTLQLDNARIPPYMQNFI